MNSANSELVAIAKIVKPRGIRGEVSADILTDFPERFEDLETVVALSPEGKRRDLKIEDFSFQKNRILLKFESIGSIEDAEILRDWEICVPETETVELEADEFYDWQLADCEVVTFEDEKIGRVKEVMRTGGTEILVVQGAERDFLIPFAESICQEVDIEKKLIRIDAPEGLLEF